MASPQAERINMQMRNAQAEELRTRVTRPPVSPAASEINAQVRQAAGARVPPIPPPSLPPPPLPPSSPGGAGAAPSGLRSGLTTASKIKGGIGTLATAGLALYDASDEIQSGVPAQRALARSGLRVGGSVVGSALGGAAGGAAGGLVSSPTVAGIPVGVAAGTVAGMAGGGYAGHQLGNYLADGYLPVDTAATQQGAAPAQGQNQLAIMDGSGSAEERSEQARLLANSRAGQVQVLDGTGSNADLRAQGNLRQQLGPVLPQNAADTNYNYGVASNEERLMATTPRGSQGAHITNGDTVENRLSKIASSASFRGSPSMRRAAAEAVMQEDQQRWKSGESVLDRNSAADIEAARLQSGLDDNRAARGLRRETFNSELGETRRNNDLQGKAAMVEANAKLIESQGKARAEQLKALNDRANKLMDERLKAGDTVEQASAFAGDALHAMGFDPEQVDAARGSNFYRGQTVADAGHRREAVTGLGSMWRNARNGLEEMVLGVDSNPTRGVGAENFQAQGAPSIAQRVGLQLIPGGYSANGDNAPVIWNDATTGGTFATPRSTLRSAGVDNMQRWRDRYNQN